jgi:hypothetical protein
MNCCLIDYRSNAKRVLSDSFGFQTKKLLNGDWSALDITRLHCEIDLSFTYYRLETHWIRQNSKACGIIAHAIFHQSPTCRILSQPRNISLQILIFGVSEIWHIWQIWQMFGGFGNVWDVVQNFLHLIALNYACSSSSHNSYTTATTPQLFHMMRYICLRNLTPSLPTSSFHTNKPQGQPPAKHQIR